MSPVFRREVEAARVEIDRLTVRAPVEGDILQVNVRPGEYAPSGPVLRSPLSSSAIWTPFTFVWTSMKMTPGVFNRMSPAVASIRGNPQFKTELTFEYVETYVVPKRSLTGESTERVDTRVMQVIYSFKREPLSGLSGTTHGCLYR